jgi:hypothetical protein
MTQAMKTIVIRRQLAYTPQNEHRVNNHYMGVNSNSTASQQNNKDFLFQIFFHLLLVC